MTWHVEHATEPSQAPEWWNVEIKFGTGGKDAVGQVGEYKFADWNGGR